MTPSENCLQLCKHFEGCRLSAYQDSGGLWTIGYGVRMLLNGRPVREGDKILQSEADQLLAHDLRRFSSYVDFDFKGILLSQQQYDALTDFYYNRGPGNALKSRLIRLVKVNPNSDLIYQAFTDRENIIDRAGNELAGLRRRRIAEAWLYFEGVLKFQFD